MRQTRNAAAWRGLSRITRESPRTMRAAMSRGRIMRRDAEERALTARVVCACGRRLAVLRLADVGTLREIADTYGGHWPCDRCPGVLVDGRAFGLALVRARRTGVVRLPLAGRP